MTASTSSGLTRREVLKRGAVTGAGLLWVKPSAQAFGMSSTLAADTSGGTDGCTPGFWKNSPGSWTDYANTTIAEAFDLPLEAKDWPCLDDEGIDPGVLTLMEALSLNGGGVKALLRHAAAGYLNSMHSGVNYGYASSLTLDVYSALENCEGIEALKDSFAAANERGCPLANDNSFK